MSEVPLYLVDALQEPLRLAARCADPLQVQHIVLNSRTTTWQKCEAVPRRARI